MAPQSTPLQDRFPIPNFHVFDDEDGSFDDRPIMEEWILDSLLHNGVTLHLRSEDHTLLFEEDTGSESGQHASKKQFVCDQWGNFYDLSDCCGVLPTGMKLIHQTLDNFFWSHGYAGDCTFGGESDVLTPADYLRQLFNDDKALRPERLYDHGGYLRVNGVRSGDLALLRKWAWRLQHEEDAALFASGGAEAINAIEPEQITVLHGVRLQAKDFAVRWCSLASLP